MKNPIRTLQHDSFSALPVSYLRAIRGSPANPISVISWDRPESIFGESAIHRFMQKEETASE